MRGNAPNPSRYHGVRLSRRFGSFGAHHLGVAALLLAALTVIHGCSGQKSVGGRHMASDLTRATLSSLAPLRGKPIEVSGRVTQSRVYPAGNGIPVVPKGGALVTLGGDGRWGDNLWFVFKEDTSNGFAIARIKKGDTVTVEGTVAEVSKHFAGDGVESTHGFPVFKDFRITGVRQ